MSKKFTLPKKYKAGKNLQGLINWYEDKLVIMEGRQASLSRKLSKVHHELKLLSITKGK